MFTLAYFSLKRNSVHLPVAGDGLEASIVSSERNVKSDKRLASLDKVEFLLVDSGFGSSGVVEKLNLFEETRLTVSIKLWSEFGLSSKCTHWHYKN